MLRWSGQNANQKVGPDKMPTTEKKSHGQNANLGWHFVRLAFCPTTVLMFILCMMLMIAYNVDVYVFIFKDHLTSALRTSIASARAENVHKSREQRADTRPTRALGDIPSQWERAVVLF